MVEDNDILFLLTKEDAQIIAGDIIGRTLSSLEMEYVKKGLEYGLEYWADVMRIAIKRAVEHVRYQS